MSCKKIKSFKYLIQQRFEEVRTNFRDLSQAAIIRLFLKNKRLLKKLANKY